MSYVSGFLTPVKAEDKERYVASARQGWAIFKEFGALSMTETWGDNVPDGEHTSFPMAVKLEPGEAVVFSWILWPDRATADSAWEKMMSDERMKDMDMPFDGKRMMWGGFQPIFES
jgi:uncharacterized protein YbaA (DUF1428 family)